MSQNTKRVTKAQQVRSFVLAHGGEPNGQETILSKTMELGLIKPLAKTYIKNAIAHIANEQAGTLPKRGRKAKPVEVEAEAEVVDAAE